VWFGQQVCLYGGAYDEGQLGDTWMLDLSKMEWTCLIDQTTQNKAWHAVAAVAGPAVRLLFPAYTCCDTGTRWDVR
jgi:hypothetical protein